MVKARKGGQFREFTEEVWKEMPAGKYGWQAVAEMPEEVQRAIDAAKPSYQTVDFSFTDKESQMVGFNDHVADSFSTPQPVVELINEYRKDAKDIDEVINDSHKRESELKNMLDAANARVSELEKQVKELEDKTTATPISEAANGETTGEGKKPNVGKKG